MHPTTSQIAAVLAVLFARRGASVVTRDEVAGAVSALPNGSRLTIAESRRVVDAVLHWMHPAGSHGLMLNEAALSLIGFPLDGDLSLSPEEDAQLVELLRSRAHGDSLDGGELASVTRRFLEDALAGADIPDELLQAVVAAYVRRGTLTMSEDGGRYTISL